MMKGKIKYFILILGAILLVMPYQVNAAKAWVSQNGSKDHEIEYDNGKVYQDYHITVQYDDGKNYDAYCVDFGATMNGGNDPSSVTCQEISSPALAYIMNDSSASHEIKQLASRVIAQEMGITKTDHFVTSDNGTMDSVNNLVNAANNQTGGIIFTKVSGSGNVVTYSLSSVGNLDGVGFTCQNCSIESSNWNGTSGSITVSAITPNCDFQIIATYNGVASYNDTKVMYCSGSGTIQGTVFTINGSVSSENSGSVTTGQVKQVFAGSIDASTGGSYYKEYCDENPDTCVCDEGPDISMPGYCDSNGNMMSGHIYEPKNVTQCILNGRDSNGNSYKMNDGQISNDNKYCAVYCKEDYDMELPGAKYTDSGRFFTLENTKITGKRTCYATNPNNDCHEPEILIDDFVQDVMNQQKAIMDAFNKYQLAKAKYDSVAAISNSSDTRKVTCQVYNSQTHSYNDVEYEYQYAKTGEDKSMKVATLWDKNTLEGSKGVRTDDRLASATIGYNFSCADGFSVAGEHATVAEYKTDMDEAKKQLIEAQNTLKQTIGWMEECYKWTNNFCLDPVVRFDYEEQYNSNINYERVDSGDTTIVGSNATYHNQKTIDNAYTANSGGTLETIDYAYCTEDNCINGGEGTATNISTLVNHLYYRKVEAEGTAEYANTQEFQTHYPSGAIEPSNGATRPNYSYLGTVYPVALNTPTGQYKWTLNFSNLGMKNESGCFLGRLDNITADLEYVCTYVVDCDDCDYDCIGEGCLIPSEPKCPECDVYCNNCIFNGDGLTFHFEVETLNNSNPSERARGINWSNEKGEATAKAIEDLGENVYVEAQYVYRMTPEDMAAIRKYNAETENYVNEYLSYQSIGGYANAYGESQFLTDGQKNGYFTEIKRTKDRTLWSGSIGEGMGPVWKVGK